MNKIPKILKDQIIEDYISDNFESIPQLAEKHNVNTLTLKGWIYSKDKEGLSLKDRKTQLQEEIKSQAIKVSTQELSKSLKLGGQILTDILFKLQANLETGAYTNSELVKIYGAISTSLKNVHGTIRLEDGKSTANFATSTQIDSASLKTALEAIKNDPFGSFGDILDV